MNTFKILFAGLAAVVAVSCTKNNDGPEGGSVELTASIIDCETKIAFDGESGSVTKTKWEESDKIWVRSNLQPASERGECFWTDASKISVDGKTAKFIGVVRNDGNLAAVYPYQYVNEASRSDKIILDVPQEKYLVENNCPYISNFSAAFWTDGSSTFSMKPLFGAMKISLTGSGEKILKIRIYDNNAKHSLCGTCNVVPDYSKGDVKSISFSSTSANSNMLQLTAKALKTLDSTPYVFYFIAPEGSFADGITISFFDAEDQLVKSLVSTKNNAIVRGSVRKMPNINVTDIPVPSDFSGGTGTEADPYLIANKADLLSLAEKVDSPATHVQYADKYYRQIAGIDLNGETFASIGLADYQFKGNYNGSGNVIDNCAVGGTGASGVFSYANGAVISDLCVTNRTNNSSGTNTGGIVGYATNCTVSDCEYTSGELTTSANVCGGIIGYANGGSVSGCKVSGKITATSARIGGIIGEAANNVIISGCSASGAVISGKNVVAAIVGEVTSATISGCTVTGSTVKGTSTDVAAVAGEVQLATISKCIVEGGSSISGTKWVGGVVGSIREGSIIKCKLRGTSKVTGSSCNVGGVLGGSFEPCQDVTIDNCYMQEKSHIKGAYYVGGIAGYLRPAASKTVVVINSGVGSGYIESTTSDNSSNPQSGDCCNGGICGWARASNSGSTIKIINCFAYMSGGGFPVDIQVDHPSIADIVGFVSGNSTGKIMVENCSGNLYLNDIVVNGVALSTWSASYRCGAIYGYLNSNFNTMTIKHNFYISGKQLELGSNSPDNVVISGNQGYSKDTFEDGSTVKNLLNAYVNSYAGPETLMTWSIYSNRPYIQ